MTKLLLAALVTLSMTTSVFAKTTTFTCEMETLTGESVGFDFSFKLSKKEYTGSIKPFGFDSDYAYATTTTKLKEDERYSSRSAPLGMCSNNQTAILLKGKDKLKNLYHVQFCVNAKNEIATTGSRAPQVSVNEKNQHWPIDSADGTWLNCK